MQTIKSSFTSRWIVNSKFAAKSIINIGINCRNNFHRSLPLRVTRTEREAISAAVGLGKRVIIQPVKQSKGNAMAPIKAVIQNSLT